MSDLARRIWRLLESLAAFGLLIVAMMSALDHDYARAAFDLALAIYIRMPAQPSGDEQA